MEITPREIIASISILAIMLILGIIVGSEVNDAIQDEISRYNKALKITDGDIFKYAMSTNVGDAFIEGEFKVLDPIQHDDIEGNYTTLRVVKEVYTEHTRTETYTDSNGKTQTRIETYWTWDEVSRENFKSEKINFLDVDFDTSLFYLPGDSYITTKDGGYHVRYKYYGLEESFNATIFTQLRDNTINEGTTVYKGQSLNSVVEDLTDDSTMIVFYILWSILTALVIYGFMYLDNNWLNK